MIVNIHDAKTHLSKYIAKVVAGEEIVIAKSGKPLVKLSLYEEETSVRKGGQLKGLIKIGPDFDAPLPDEIDKAFKGE